MTNSKNYSPEFHFPVENMGNRKKIKDRIRRIEEQKNLKKQQLNAIERILEFLYIEEYVKPIYRKTIKNNEEYLSMIERRVAYWLETRCSGSEKKNYGINAVLAVKRAKYKCEICKQKDIRCLEIDHIPEKVDNEGKKIRSGFEVKEFKCLCANHHKIKTVNKPSIPPYPLSSAYQ